MNNRIRILISTVFCIALFAGRSYSDVRRTRAESGLNQLGIAMFLYKEDHDGNFPESLDVLTPYVELDTLEEEIGRPLEGNIMLLTRGIWVSPTEGKRIWALIKIPRSDGKYDVLYEPFDSLYPSLGVLSAEQLRALGIEPIGAISSEGDKNLVESIWSSAKKTLGISLKEKRGAGSSSGAKWLYGVLGIALLCLLVIILRARLQQK